MTGNTPVVTETGQTVQFGLGVIAAQLTLTFLATTGVRILRRLLYEQSAVRRLATKAVR